MISSTHSTHSGINWEEVKRRLARVQEALASVEHLSPAQAKAILDERARVLAQAPDHPPETREILEVLVFRLADERFAIETQVVREVIRPDEMTPLPGAPEFLVGLTNLRGDVLAMMDLRTVFGLSPAEQEPYQAVILGADRTEFGLLVDGVEDVVALRLDEILDPSASISGVNRDLMRGVTRDAMLVLDGNGLLQDERLYVDEID